ncbi:hypothetical protein K435DRAFT_712399 [Dendrothele bispora CBS 962.96]|uniref:Cupin 2 conserved barrel domain-containing protein n=1 Tax=Dendrothele bispora (strain CBS 962.96) TaxID=1314807 RepID=A0A4S8MTL8_DENBC|nr:hypothetical protein K435DRAFT_712399 [Dendrothele bispora CBS 962.96]
MSVNVEDLPESISVLRGVTMTFLRNEPYISRVEIAADADQFFVPKHWHETHDEIMRVVKGKLDIMLGSTWKTYTPEDGEVVIKKGVVHSLRAARGEETVFHERTSPMDGEKEMFFRNIFSVGGMDAKVLAVMQVFYHGDTVPVFPIHIPWMEKLFTTIFGYYIAPFFGHRLPYAHLKTA